MIRELAGPMAGGVVGQGGQLSPLAGASPQLKGMNKALGRRTEKKLWESNTSGMR